MADPKSAVGIVRGYKIAREDERVGRGPTRRFEFVFPDTSAEVIVGLHHQWLIGLPAGAPQFGGICVDKSMIVDENPLYPVPGDFVNLLHAFLAFAELTVGEAADCVQINHPQPLLTLGLEEGYGTGRTHEYSELLALVVGLDVSLKPVSVQPTIVTYGWHDGKKWNVGSERGALLRLRPEINYDQAQKLACRLGAPLVQTRVYTTAIQGETLIWQAIRDSDSEP